MTENSKFFSAHCSPRLQNRTLPHVTIQCPVYKEGLHSVIVPTVRSIKQAISTYELQGGSANMFICDDGLQIIDEEERRQRIDFYADNCIGWTARPKHGLNGFRRKGKFKKVCCTSILFSTSHHSFTHIIFVKSISVGKCKIVVLWWRRSTTNHVRLGDRLAYIFA